MQNRSSALDISLSRNNTNNITSPLLVLLTLFVHPYIVVIIAAVAQLYTKISIRYFLPLCSLSLALFWGSRNFGFTKEGFSEDALFYMQDFLKIKSQGINDIFYNYVQNPSGNEIVYAAFNYLIGFFTSNQRVFAFSIYLLIAVLISLAAVLTDSRYYMVYIATLFFGIGSFVSLEVMHLWRSTIGSLIFLIGFLCYPQNKRIGVLIIVTSVLAYIPVVLLALIFVASQYLSQQKFAKNGRNYSVVVLLISLFLLLVFYLATNNYLNFLILQQVSLLLFKKDFVGLYIGNNLNVANSWFIYSLNLLVVGIAYYFLVLKKMKNNNVRYGLLPKSKIVERSVRFFRPRTDIYNFHIILFLCMTQVSTIISYITPTGLGGRFYQLTIVFTALMTFQILSMIRRKTIIFFILVLFFILKFITIANSDFTRFAYTNFTHINQGIFFTLSTLLDKLSQPL